LVFVELKTDHGKLSKRQAFWHNRLRSLGFDVIVAKGRRALVEALAEAA
jgi:methylmalonyl-CoA mutase cobalamin-binding subunit